MTTKEYNNKVASCADSALTQVTQTVNRWISLQAKRLTPSKLAVMYSQLIQYSAAGGGPTERDVASWVKYNTELTSAT